MGPLSIWHWLIVFPIALALYLVPAARILKKAGYSGWLSLILFVPLLNLIMYWVFAFVTWPVERGTASR
jgi:hypothetical protein